MHHPKSIVIPPARFLRRYAPLVGENRKRNLSKIFKHAPITSAGEVGHGFEPLVTTLNESKLCPGFKFAVTAARRHTSESSENEVLYIGLYSEEEVPRASKDPDGKILPPRTDCSRVELLIDYQAGTEVLDPFDKMNTNHEPATEDRKRVLDRLLSYVESVMQRQQRTWVFMVLLLGDFCRLARFDRSGIIVTERFNYKTCGGSLIEFLWRYARWNPAERGHDPSAERIEPSSELGMKMLARAQKEKDPSKDEDYVRQAFEDSLYPRHPWWKLRVDDEHGPRFFLVGDPDVQASGVVGRGTRGYVALDASNIDGPFYYLKDAWRVVSPGVEVEGKILGSLNKKEVEYIPTLECHGDIASPPQTTETNELWDYVKKGEAEERGPFKQHKHYRIVVREVCKPMQQFAHTRQLVFALWCCIYAHYQAYEAGVIHRDISAVNVLLYYDTGERRWVGLLIDWELSTGTDSPRSTRNQQRAGTWQFLSVRASDASTNHFKVEEELESFFHVLLFFCICFTHHNCAFVPHFIREYFDDCSTLFYRPGEYGCGLYKKLCVVSGHLNLRPGTLKFLWPPSPEQPDKDRAQRHPLNTIFNTLLEWLKGSYAVIPVSGHTSTATATTPDATTPEAPQRGTFDGLTLNVSKAKFRFPDDEEDDGNGIRRKVKPPIPEYDSKALARRMRTMDEARAQNLRTHHAVLDLLEDALNGKYGPWPADDKTEDQREKTSEPAVAAPKRPPAADDSAACFDNSEGSIDGRDSSDRSDEATDDSDPSSDSSEVSFAGSSRKRKSSCVEQAAVQGRQKRQKPLPTRRSTRQMYRNK